MQENHCGFHIKHINDVLQRDANNTLRSEDLTLSQIDVLLHLERAPGGELSLKELEKRLQVAQSTAAGIVVRLENKKFVEAYASRNDKRIKMVRITRLGLGCCASARLHMKQTEERLLGRLTENERITFITLLKKVSEGL
ncbi:MAG: MarR family winged helix-turn-helix transcriptional regulator [Anaerovoracaceae bacterium]